MTYTHTENFPTGGSSRRAAAMQAEFELIETQFALVDSTRTTDLATLNAAIDLKADIASPTFTGTPTAPTPGVGDDSTKLATTEYVIDAIGATSAFLPPQATNSGKNLYTNGVSATWEFPSWDNVVDRPTVFEITDFPHHALLAQGII